MKKLIIILALLAFFLLPLACHATDAIFSLDCKDCQDLHGYKMYQSQVSGVYDPNNPVVVTGDPNVKNIRVTNLKDGIYYWVCTSWEKHLVTEPGVNPPVYIYNESGYSNEVRGSIDTQSPTSPGLVLEAIIKMILLGP